METQFGVVRPRQADEEADALAVQVITLVNSPASVDQVPLRETLGAMLAAPVPAGCWRSTRPAADRLPAGFELMATARR